jgi:uncharacterized protein (TIGR02246 family)
MDDESAIRQLVADRVSAMRTGDAEAICGAYAPDAVVFNLAPPLVQPPEDSRDVAQLRSWFEDKGGSVWSEVRDLKVIVDGDLALCTSLERMGTEPGSAQPFSLWLRSTLGLRRTDGEWRIVHEHRSTPFHMDGSLRAATDLEP